MADPYLAVEVDRRYVIESLIAAGGMGLVYRCRHRVLGKKLAIKIIRSDVAQMPDGSERFMLEAKAASSIGNEHIVDIVDFGAMPDGSPYLVMEYLEGISLAALLRRQPRLGVARLAGIASQIAEGLGAAHARGIVHRDLKPDNVLVLDRKGEDFIKVLDFGVARMAQSAKKLTQAGTIVGTPHYMSPEQALGLEVDHRGDIYSLGVILYELIAGRVPFDGEHYVAVLHQHLHAKPPAFASLEPRIDVPPELERIVDKCLAKAPEGRYGAMAELARELVVFREPALSTLGASILGASALGDNVEDEPSPAAPSELPVTPDPPDSAAPPLPRPQPTLALPRPSGPFTLPQKRFLTSFSVIVLIGVCALAAFRFGTSQGQKAGAAKPAAAALSPTTRAPVPAAAVSVPQRPVEAAPPVVPAPPAATPAGVPKAAAPAVIAPEAAAVTPASPAKRGAGPAKPRSSDEFMNPWPAPPR